MVVKKKFKRDKFSMSFRGDNLFPPSTRSLTQKINKFDFTQELTNRYQSQHFWVSCNWKFGKKEGKASVVRTIEKN